MKSLGVLVTKLCLTLETPWSIACHAPLSMGFPRQRYWSRLPFPSPRDLPDPGIEPTSPMLQADSSPSEPHFKDKLHAIGACMNVIYKNSCCTTQDSVTLSLNIRALEWPQLSCRGSV